MILFPLVALLSFGLIIMLAGLFALSYFRKEGLGKLYMWTSKLTVACGMLIVVGGLIAATLVAVFHSSCKDGGVKCRVEMQRHYGGEHCSRGEMSHCKRSCQKSCDKPCEKSCKKKVCKKSCDGKMKEDDDDDMMDDMEDMHDTED